jgi:4-carboxymuconolactone decarboxylase
MTPRIPPIPVDEQVGEVAELLGVVRGENALHDQNSTLPPLNVFATMARHPELFRPTVALAQYLTDGLLPPSDRELVVLRAAVHCGSEYVWAHHCNAARAAGVSDEKITRVADGTGTWAPREQALLDAVDDLHTGTAVQDETWRALSAHYDEAELIELVMLVGEYRKIACFLNTMGTPLDDWTTAAPPFTRP